MASSRILPYPRSGHVRAERSGVLAAMLGVCLLALGLRLFHLEVASVWWDEGYSAFLASRDLGDLLRRAAIDIHPPLYYILLAGWTRGAGTTEFALRYFSVMPAVLLIALLYRIGASLAGPLTGLGAALVSAISPFLVEYSQQARMYTWETLAITLSAALAIVLVGQIRAQQAVIVEERPPLSRLMGIAAAYVFVTTVALYFDYFPAFVLAAQTVGVGACVVGWLARRQWAAAGQLMCWWIACLLAIVVLYMPWLGVAYRQIAGYGYGRSTAPTPAEFIRQVWLAFAIGPAADPYWGWPPALLLAVIAVVLTLVALWRAPTRAVGLIGLVGFLLPIGLFGAALLLRPFFHVRYLLVALPGYSLLLGAGLAAIAWRRPLRAAPIWLLLALASAVGLMAGWYAPAFIREDTRTAAAYLRRVAGPDDVILWQTPYPFLYYYDGPARHLEWRPRPTPDVAARFAAAIGSARTVYWQTWYQSVDDLWGITTYLLEKAGRQLEHRTFPGYAVDHYLITRPVVPSIGDLVPMDVNFANVLRLTGAGFGPPDGLTAVPADRRPWVLLRFRAIAPLPPDLKFTVHLVDDRGRLLGQVDGWLLDDRGATSQYWRTGVDHLMFASPRITPGTPPTRARVQVGVYAGTDQRPLPIVGGRTGSVFLGWVPIDPPTEPFDRQAVPIARRLDLQTAGLRLLGVDLPESTTPRTVAAGDTLTVGLYWQRIGAVPSSGPAVLALVNTMGQTVTSTAAPPLATYPVERWRSGDLYRDERALTIGADLPSGRYMWELRWAGVTVQLATVDVSARTRPRTLPPTASVVDAAFEGGVRLLGYELAPRVQAGSTVTLTLYWSTDAAIAESFTVFTHLLDAENRVIAQHDGLPGDGQDPTTSWRPGEVIVDRHVFPVKSDVATGRYPVEVGLYRALDGSRLRLIGGDDHVVLTTVEIY